MSASRSMLIRWRWVWRLLAATALVAPSVAHAQRAGVAMQQGPYYVGDPILVRVTAEGFEEEPQAKCEPQNVDPGLDIKLARVSPQRSSFVQIINGRRTERTSVTFNFDFQVTAAEPGTYSIGGFTVKQGASSATTNGVKLQVQEMEREPDSRILLNLPSGPIFPGQHVPVTLEWWYAGELGAVSSIVIRAELFDRFRFEDDPIRQGDTTIPIVTGTDTVQVKAEVEEGKQFEGRSYVVVKARRTLIADKPGRFELAPVTITLEKATQWSRDVFGRRRATRTKRVRAVGEPQTLVVKSIPLAKAPPGYAGAVGQGFSLDVTADRTVVHAGDPIRLTFTLRGDGNLESAGLTALGHSGGLDPQKFRSPESDATGVMNEDGQSKRFEVSVRPLDASVNRIPPVTYAWFDPERDTFETTQSSPIALQVLEAQMIGARDVVDANGDANTEADVIPDDGPRSDVPAGDMTGADLTLATDISRLMTPDRARYGGVLGQVGVYGVSILLMLLAWWRRRQAEQDPAVRERRRLMKAQLTQIQHAAEHPRQRAARDIAAACRQLLPYAHDGERSDLDAVIAECDALAFAPAGADEQRIDENLHRRAVEAARRIAREKA